ncbi:PilN domain-containing protein [Dongshaea marina]|uniref:PilN domain-containing protein n=1 Tax=Dongshaea marina TaxID=2047966 RepID=UPI000D3EDD3E|nr:PilN domain-containing protein [Dongshaea marina]
MSAINLLPWREAVKQRQKTQFFTLLGCFAVLTLLLVFAVNWFIGKAVDNQNSRNQYLQREMVVLDSKIGEIQRLKKRRAQLIERMDLINQLQLSRNLSVHLFNQLPKVVPPGVYLGSLKLNNKRIDVVGDTEAYSRVANMMRRIESSGWLGNTKILSIFETQKEPIILSQFSLYFDVLNQNRKSKEASNGSAAAQ